MSIITTHIGNEEVIVLNGFKLNEGEIYVTDANEIGSFEKIRVVIEPSMVKYIYEENDLDMLENEDEDF